MSNLTEGLKEILEDVVKKHEERISMTKDVIASSVYFRALKTIKERRPAGYVLVDNPDWVEAYRDAIVIANEVIAEKLGSEFIDETWHI